MNKKWLWIIGLLVIGVVAVGGSYYWITMTAVSAEENETEEVQTSTVRQGDMTISATGAGTVVPAQEINLSFAGSGVLTEILVQVGQDVQEGDVLARLDDMDAQEALSNAELQLTLALMQTDASATQAGMSFDDISVEQARLNLEAVQETLDDLLEWEPDADEIAQAEASLEAAQASLNAARGQESSSYSNIQVKQIDLEQAQRALADAETAVTTAYDQGREWELYIDDPSCRTGEQHPNCTGPAYSDNIKNERESADFALQRAIDNLAIAEANYGSAVTSSNSSSSTSAQGSVLNAELVLKAAQTEPTENEISAAEKAVRQEELSLQQTLLNQEKNQMSLEISRMNVTVAEKALTDTALKAPIDGTVMAVNGAVGENVSNGIIALADLEQPLIEIFLDETDLDKVGLDFEVEIVFDALPDDIFTGHIIQIDPQLTDQQGVSAIRALALLDEDSFAKPQTLPIGLNATVEVIGGRAADALLVPVEAVRELSPGSYALFVMENGEPELRMVEVGLMDFTFAEIISGVVAGEVVTTGLIVTQ